MTCGRPQPLEHDIDLLDGDMYASGPFEIYAWLRDHAPLYWDRRNELWAVSRHRDIVEIEKRKDVFISSDQLKGGYRPNMPADGAIIGLDDPAHQRRRSLVSRRFTPRSVAAWEAEIRSMVTRLLDAVEDNGGAADAVSDLAAPLPAMMIGRILGFPEERWRDLQRWSEQTIAIGGGPRYRSEQGAAAIDEFFRTAVALHAEKLRCPADDVMTVWTHAEIDGRKLDPSTVAMDCLLLLDGGAETTRTVIARSLVNLVHNPGVWAQLQAGADLTTAVEELIRYVTPIHNMCRVAITDYDIAGGTIPAGHQVVMMYGAANRDPSAFRDPERLEITRDPNPHLAFGFGTHFCLGAALARAEIRIFFEELLRRVERFTIRAGTSPVEMPNAFVYGLRSVAMEFAFK